MLQYGIPLDLDMMLFYYRSDVVDPILEKLGMKSFPTDWAGFQKVAEAVRDAGGGGPDTPRLLQLDPEDPVPLRMAFLPSSGGMLFNKEMTRATFDSPEAQAAFQYFSGLIASDAALPWNRNTMGDAFDVIKSGRILGNIAGPWFGKLLEGRAPEMAGKWRVALFPKREPQYPSCGLGGACLVMPYNATNRRGAVALAKFMSENAFALEYFKRVGSPPPQVSAWNNPIFDEGSPYFGGQQVYKVVRQAIDQSRPLQLMPNAEIVKSHVRWALSAIARDRADVPSTLAKAVNQANQLLSMR
jgi:ABC-type glycerol-3-phosphate transport system substrate-binding protein